MIGLKVRCTEAYQYVLHKLQYWSVCQHHGCVTPSPFCPLCVCVYVCVTVMTLGSYTAMLLDFNNQADDQVWPQTLKLKHDYYYH